jgi:hypothetical protein
MTMRAAAIDSTTTMTTFNSGSLSLWLRRAPRAAPINAPIAIGIATSRASIRSNP